MKNTKQSKRKGDLLGKRSFHTTNKKAVSLMLSYVLLISIILVLSIGVYSWLKLVANVEPEVDCKDDTSIIIKDYSCDPTSTISNFDLTLKNNGRFSVEGVIVTVGNDSSKTPMTYLVPNKMGGLLRGHYYFLDLLKPGEEVTVNFFNNGSNNTNEIKKVNFENIRIIEIQPFITSDTERIICQDAVKKIPIEDCQIATLP